jgi:hypothetical protein
VNWFRGDPPEKPHKAVIRPKSSSFNADPRPAVIVSDARAAAIAHLLEHGYELADGTHRRVHSPTHANFLANAKTIVLPE